MLFLLRTTNTRGRESMVPALRLGRGLSAGYEPVNGHLPSGHHSCVLIGLSFYWFGYLGRGIRHFNGHMEFVALRYTLCLFVSHRCTVLCGSISGAKVPSFTNGQGWWKEVGVPNVNIGDEGTVN